MEEIRAQFGKEEAEALLARDTDQLYEMLGMRAEAVTRNLAMQATFTPRVEYQPHMGPMEDLKKIGKKMLDRVHVQVYGLMCGNSSQDEEDREKILAALGIGTDAVVVALAGVLISGFGIAAVFAGVLAALIVKRFMLPALDAGLDGVCELWGEHVPD